MRVEPYINKFLQVLIQACKVVLSFLVLGYQDLLLLQ